VTNFLSEPGFCLTPVTPHTLFLTRKKTGLSPSHQELTGSPRFLCASPHTCHALMTPAVPPESRQKISDSFVSASVTLKTWPTAPMPVTTLFHASGVRLTPCGPHDFPVYASCGSFVGMSVFPVHATPGTGGWPDLSRQGLSPCRKHQALLGALTPKFRWPVKIVGDHQPRSISALRNGVESLNPDCQIRAGIRPKFRWPVQNCR